MRKLFVSAVALSAAIGFAAPAAAQAMIGSSPISPEQLPFVQAQCDLLALDAKIPETLAEEGGIDSDPQEVWQALTTVDLNTIGYGDCEAAGFYGDGGFEILPAAAPVMEPVPFEQPAPFEPAPVDALPAEPVPFDQPADQTLSELPEDLAIGTEG